MSGLTYQHKFKPEMRLSSSKFGKYETFSPLKQYLSLRNLIMDKLIDSINEKSIVLYFVHQLSKD